MSYSKTMYSVGYQLSGTYVQQTAVAHYLLPHKGADRGSQSSNISKSGRSDNPLKVAKTPWLLQWIISRLSKEKSQTECEDIWKFLPSRLNDPVDFLFRSILGWSEVCAE